MQLKNMQPPYAMTADTCVEPLYYEALRGEVTHEDQDEEDAFEHIFAEFAHNFVISRNVLLIELNSSRLDMIARRSHQQYHSASPESILQLFRPVVTYISRRFAPA